MLLPPQLRLPKTPLAVLVGAESRAGSGGELVARSPIDGLPLATFRSASAADATEALAAAKSAFATWRLVPAPRRGELVRLIGQRLREAKPLLAQLVTIESGKILAEAQGEVQEMIDICDFAVGLSRQLHGLTMPSERPGHRMMEQWHPLGPVGVITAFNFPVAVWAWNAMIALACGDTLVWKPSEKTSLCAVAVHQLAQQAIAEFGGAPDAILSVILGGREAGAALASSPLALLVSATGSVPMGRAVSQAVAARLGRSLLELGGNNAMILAPSADLELAVRAIVFAAAGTAGQRCTTLRRLIVHRSIQAQVVDRLKTVFQRLPVGDPTDPATLVGPLIDGAAFEAMQHALKTARSDGASASGGERLFPAASFAPGAAADLTGGFYVRPAIVEISAQAPIVCDETFAPILWVMGYDTLEEAVAIQNNVPQGLSSAIFTNDQREAETFLSAAGSDCGIANVNLGTSGAEIGGAFGGEKATGGGRESGSDAWKAYMRRATNTINYSRDLPLAQDIDFDAGA